MYKCAKILCYFKILDIALHNLMICFKPIKSKQFQLNSPVYVAGVASGMYARLPTTIKAPHGFVGCLASLDINGVQPDLISAGNGNKHKLISGCFGM